MKTKTQSVLLIAGLCLGAVLLAACKPVTAPVAGAAAAPAGGGDALMANRWQLTGLTDANGQSAAVPAGVDAWIQFHADGKLNGNGGCNNFAGAYTVDGDKLTIQPGAMTQMACPPPADAIEADFVKALASTATYQVDGGQLTLLDASGQGQMVFAPAKETSLTGTNWNATGYNNGKQALVSLQAGTTITALFAADGHLSGSAGCNNYSATFQVDGSKLTIGPAASTRKYCGEPGVMEQEQAYLTALTHVATYEIQGDKLTLRDGDGAMQATYIGK